MPVCTQCKKTFSRRIMIEGKLHDCGSGRVKCFDCLPFDHKNKKKPLVKCENCGKETKNPKFCTIACAARMIGDTRLTNKCEKCKKPISNSRKYCKDCFKQLRDDLANRTIQEVLYDKGHRCNSFGKVRFNSRFTGLKLGFKKCAICGYDKHIEVAHKKSVSSFPLDTPISIVNHPDNLFPLCPNCHWEFDHGLIKIDEIFESFTFIC